MTYVNVEIKARCNNPDLIRKYLKENNAEFKGTDHQTDTYFNASSGRLKLREGNIENSLIFYQRPDQPGAKESHFQLVKVPDSAGLKKVLSESLGIKVAVKKRREIYFIANVKFHIDEVEGLGNFSEIEASNLHQNTSKEELQKQCNFYLDQFKIDQQDLIASSYSDMLLEKSK
jgi:adenylate cyclase class 2